MNLSFWAQSNFYCCKQSLNRLYHSSIHPSIPPAPDFCKLNSISVFSSFCLLSSHHYPSMVGGLTLSGSLHVLALGLCRQPSPGLGSFSQSCPEVAKVGFIELRSRVYDECMGPSVLAHAHHRTNLFGLRPFLSEVACLTTVIRKSDFEVARHSYIFQSLDVNYFAI